MGELPFRRILIPLTVCLSLTFFFNGLVCPFTRFHDVERYIPYLHETGDTTSFVHGPLAWAGPDELLYSTILPADLEKTAQKNHRELLEKGGRVYQLRISDAMLIKSYAVDAPVRHILVNHHKGLAYAITPLSIWKLDLNIKTAQRLNCTIPGEFVDAFLFDSDILFLDKNRLYRLSVSNCRLRLLKLFKLERYDEFTSLFRLGREKIVLFLNAPVYYELDLLTMKTRTFKIHGANYPMPGTVHLGDKVFLIQGMHSIWSIDLGEKYLSQSIDVGPFNTAIAVTGDKKTAYVLTGRGIAEVPLTTRVDRTHLKKVD
jgi:hypothetical protein